MLITLGGLPGTGKTTVAKKIARKLSAVYLRIDSLEQALICAGIKQSDIGPAGYFAGHAIAADNLRLGLTVVADSVNSLRITRSAWHQVAFEAQVPCVNIEFICSDKEEHRQRVSSRIADIPGLQLPSWEDVITREYEPWDNKQVVIDTATHTVDQAVEAIIQLIKQFRHK
jgi:predicted kinase